MKLKEEPSKNGEDETDQDIEVEKPEEEEPKELGRGELEGLGGEEIETTEISDDIEENEISASSILSPEAKEKLMGYVEAALFIAGRPISETELAGFFNTDRITVRWALRRLKSSLVTQNSALEVLHLTKDRWVLQLCEEFSKGLFDYIDQFVPKEEMLTREEVNVLTEIAYRQPITSALLVKLLGQPTIYDYIRHLEEKGFITVEKQERTNLLKTSKKFADIYGFDPELRNLKIQLVWRLKKRAQFDKN